MAATQQPTLTAQLRRTAGRHPAAPAIVERGGDGAPVTLTYAELDARAGALAGALAAHGVGSGDVVAVWLPNWTEALVLEFALARLGATFVGVNTRYGVHELAHLVARSRPVGLVAPAAFLDLDFAGRLRAALADAGDLAPPWVAVARGAAPELDVGAGTWPLEDGTAEPVTEDRGRPRDLLNCFTTSGSTGLPKLAAHDQAAVAGHADAVARVLALQPGDVVLGVLPFSGVFGFNPMMGALAAGAAVLLEPVFDPVGTLDAIAAHDVTHVLGGDDLLGRLRDAWHEQPRPLPALRRLAIADFAGRTDEVVAWARELDVPITGLYGSSELFALTGVWPEDADPARRTRGGGRLVSDALAVRVADPATGRPCAVGEVGELQFRGPNVLDDYLGDPGARAAAFTADGWFHSGDLGELCEEPGTFLYLCRAGDALRLRGFLVEPAEIETFLAGLDGVETAKVVGVRGPDGADAAVAYVTARPGAAPAAEDLLAAARERLAPFKVPSHLEVIDAFPVTTGTNGTKIRTAELRRRAAATLGGTVPGGR